MKYLLVLFLFMLTLDGDVKVQKNVKTLGVKEKKQRFISIMLPAVNKVYDEFLKEYNDVKDDMKYSRNLFKKETLMREYKVESDYELLMALKPHPKSITLAQAAIESAWGTSRFFKEANNVFGMWSSKKNEPRIAALEKRGKKTIWLKKFDSIEESIRAYYKLLAKSPMYKEFRELKMQSDDVYLLESKLDRYCELGKEYCKQLEKITRYNKLTKYD